MVPKTEMTHLAKGVLGKGGPLAALFILLRRARRLCFAFQFVIHAVAESKVDIFKLAFFALQRIGRKHELEIFGKRAGVLAKRSFEGEPFRERDRKILVVLHSRSVRRESRLPQRLQERDKPGQVSGDECLPDRRGARRNQGCSETASRSRSAALVVPETQSKRVGLLINFNVAHLKEGIRRRIVGY